ncbi:MAG TPA: hypothetical protein DIC48_05540 [Leuconostoc pseudomesenteroides]|nr:hypothetical protein [Leuconostoc pseudomesenteroides]
MTNNIRLERKNQKKLLKDVSKDLQIPINTLSNYERGDREPKLETWKKLADYFGVDVGYLQGVTNVKNANTKMYTSDPNKMTKEQFESELFGYVKKVGVEQFRKEGDARILQYASDNLAIILQVVNDIKKETFDDPTFNYNESISNLETRSKLYSSITELTDLATYDDVGSKLLFTLLSGLIVKLSETHLINTYVSENDIDANISGAHEAIDDGTNAIEVLLSGLNDFVNEIKAQNKKASDD